MKEEIYNEKELKALEDKIRVMGIPYSENEPDERYFTNFRVHLMERIEAKERKQNIFAGAWTWLVSSPLRYLSLGVTLAGIVVAVMFIRPTSEPQVATLQSIPQMVGAPSVIIQKGIPQIAATVKSHRAEPKAVKATNLASKGKPNSVLDAANKAADFATMDETLTGGESDDPVNLENLSESELESVIGVIQDMK